MGMAQSTKAQAKSWVSTVVLAIAIGVLLLLRVPTPAAAQTTAASWLTQSTFTASSLETGHIGYVEAFGGAGGPYAYRYALSGQPASLKVDSETGFLTISPALKAGTYTFQVVVTDRKVATAVARLAATLKVVPGVTSNRQTGQILHKNYYVDSGTYGRPSGIDYTSVLLNIQKAVLADQTTVGDGNLRATIYFRRGQTYDYTSNSWPAGLQYVTVAADPAYNTTGARPRLRNVKKTFNFDSEVAIIGTGTGSIFDLAGDKIRTYSPAIYSVAAGQNQVKLKNAAEGAKLTPGRWYMVGSYDQQVEGYPPNIRYYDFVKVVSVSSGTVLLDRKLQHKHMDDSFEVPTDISSIGMARLFPLDLGGTQGFAATKRLSIRQTFKDIEFVKNPGSSNGSNTVIYMGTAIDTDFYNCIMPRPVPSIVQHVYVSGGSIQSAEVDKLRTTMIFDSVTSGEIGGATGVEFFFMRGAVTAPFQISPRHLRLINMTIDATNDTYLWYPVTFAYNGPVESAEFEATTFIVNPTNSDRRIMPSIQRPSISVVNDAHWSGTTLVIPRSSSNFLDWQVWAYEGATINATVGGAKGTIQKLSGASGGSAILVDIKWTVGQKPTTGKVWFSRGRLLSIDANSRLAGNSRWNAESGGFEIQELPASFAGVQAATE
jgi:hypothetical protein